MAYRIELAPQAYDDIDSIVAFISRDSIENAHRWRTQLFARIATLDLMPRSCALAPENEHCSFEVRQFVFGRYRVFVHDPRDGFACVCALCSARGARIYGGG